mmetsp:Transcript_40370/g.35613  ORF Transcript_40370/g.35613 Transcript_40370/m.35613 type:complete len:215 (-) Transcript_40370:198-842(-)
MKMNIALALILAGSSLVASEDKANCNHDGFSPIDYCLESHDHDLSGTHTSTSLKCEFDEANNVWFVHELYYPNSASCDGQSTIRNSKECTAADNCKCGEPANDCIDPNHQVLFKLVNGIKNKDTGLCEYNSESDSFTKLIYDGSFGVDCGGDDYIERQDTCQRIYCNADNLALAPVERRRRMFIPLIFVPIFTITASGWGQYCNNNPSGSICPN